MTKVYCKEERCKFNDEGLCDASEIDLYDITDGDYGELECQKYRQKTPPQEKELF